MNSLQKYTIAITPVDTLFFRSGIPFSIGEETWADTALIPNPSVIWGALFSTLLAEKKITTSQKSELKIKDLYLLREATKENAAKVLIPAPLDLYYIQGESGSFCEDYEKNQSFNSHYSLEYFVKPKTDEKVDTVENCFIDWIDFTSNYPKQNGFTRIYESSYFANSISKIGLARANDTRTSDDGKLYRIDMIEFERGWKIVVDFEAPIGFPSDGILRLGGEGKTATYNLLINHSLEKPEDNQDDDWFKLYFQTPAFFKSGNGILEFSKMNSAKLVSANIGRPIPIGGFDVEKQEPKPLRKAVSAGSVYVFSGKLIEAEKEINALFAKDDIEKGFCIYKLIKFLN